MWTLCKTLQYRKVCLLYTSIRDKEPDVVLLDIFMPKMDGLTVMEKVNEDKNLKKRPAFIVVSAVGEERITEVAFRLGAYYYVLKPFRCV